MSRAFPVLLACECGAIFPDKAVAPLIADISIPLFHERAGRLHRLYEIPLDRVYTWDRQGRRGQPCAILTKGTRCSALVIFADGFRMITSWRACQRLRFSTVSTGPSTRN